MATVYILISFPSSFPRMEVSYPAMELAILSRECVGWEDEQ